MAERNRIVVTPETAEELAARGIIVTPEMILVPPPGEVAILICARADEPRHFDDDVEAACADCGVGIIHRPHSAALAARKLCQRCGGDRVRGGEA